jgi:hypothetical protein
MNPEVVVGPPKSESQEKCTSMEILAVSGDEHHKDKSKKGEVHSVIHTH